MYFRYFIILLLLTGCVKFTPQYLSGSAYDKSLILFNEGMMAEAKEIAFSVKKGEPEYKAVRDLLLQIDRLAPKFAERHAALGEEYERVGLYSLAAKEYNTALEFDPDNRIISKKLEAVEQIQSSIQTEELTTANQDALASVHYKKGIAFLNSKQFAKARDEFALVMKLLPRYRDTEKLLTVATKELNETINIHLKNGIDYFQKEELELAIKEWKIVLELDPYNKTAADYKARAEAILEKMKDIQEQR